MYTYEIFFSRISKAGSEYNLSTNIYIATRQRNIKTNICCLERESSGKMEEEKKYMMMMIIIMEQVRDCLMAYVVCEPKKSTKI